MTYSVCGYTCVWQVKLCDPLLCYAQASFYESIIKHCTHVPFIYLLIYLAIVACELGDVFYLWTECDAPQLPGKKCVNPGKEFTCSATNGHPGDPTTTLYYYPNSGPLSSMVSNGESSYTVNELGKFSLYCETTYTHTCPEYTATCWANHSGVVFGEYLYRHHESVY